MSDRTIWIVMASTGEYSDRRMWLVCAYRDEQLAHRHADAAAIAAKALLERGREDDDADAIRWDAAGLRAAMGELDPVGELMQSTGTDYVALPVRVREVLP